MRAGVKKWGQKGLCAWEPHRTPSVSGDPLVELGDPPLLTPGCLVSPRPGSSDSQRRPMSHPWPVPFTSVYMKGCLLDWGFWWCLQVRGMHPRQGEDLG